MVFNHLVLGLLLPQRPLYIGYPHLNGLFVEPVCFGVLVIFESLDVEVDRVLGLNVFDVPSTEIDTGLFVNDCSLFQSYFALALLNINVCQSHALMKVFYLVLDIENVLLVFFFLFQSPHHEVRQLFSQVLSFLPLCFQSRLSLSHHFLQSEALFLPPLFLGSNCCKRGFVPH